MAKRSNPLSAEDTLAIQLKGKKWGYERQHRFCERRWMFDFAWPLPKVALEIEGGIWSGGRHTRGTGFLSDMEKYNEATLMGWKVFRFSTQQVENGEALVFLERVFGK